MPAVLAWIRIAPARKDAHDRTATDGANAPAARHDDAIEHRTIWEHDRAVDEDEWGHGTMIRGVAGRGLRPHEGGDLRPVRLSPQPLVLITPLGRRVDAAR